MPLANRLFMFGSLLIAYACSANPRPIGDLTSAIRKPAPTTPRTLAESLDVAANQYIRYLDSLRYSNAKLSLSEQKKFDVMTVVAVGLGTVAAIGSFITDDDETKAAVAGISGAVSAFITAMIAKFRHGEDAQQGRNCAKQVERLLSTFSYPTDTGSFRERRDSITARLTQDDCLAPDTR
jgi:hypothetical protein